MDKDKLKEVLQELLQDQIKHMGEEGSDLSKMINAAVKSSIEELQNTLTADPIIGQVGGTVSDSLVLNALQGARSMGGNMVITPQGSILDMGKKQTPWVKLSKEVEEWATAFTSYLKSRGKVVSKLLQESDDTAGGYKICPSIQQCVDVKLCELRETPNVEARAILSQAPYGEGATTIPKGSRTKQSEAQSIPSWMMIWSGLHGNMQQFFGTAWN